MENKKALVSIHCRGSETEYLIGSFVRRTKTQFTLLVDGKERRFKFHNPENFVIELSGDAIGFTSFNSVSLGKYIHAQEYIPSEHDHLIEQTRIKKMIERVKFKVRFLDKHINNEEWELMDKTLDKVGEDNGK